MADSNEVLALLRIADLAKNWPHLQALHDHAMEQLRKIAKEHEPAAPAPPAEPELPAPVGKPDYPWEKDGERRV